MRWKAMEYYQSNSLSIEISREGILQKVHFRVLDKVGIENIISKFQMSIHNMLIVYTQYYEFLFNIRYRM